MIDPLRRQGQIGAVHEVGIMESTLGLVARHAADHGGRRVVRVVLRIGRLSGVETDALRFAFEAISPGTVAAGAELRIEDVGVAAWCADCAREFDGSADDFVFTCPGCGNLSGEIRRGRELELSRIELI